MVKLDLKSDAHSLYTIHALLSIISTHKPEPLYYTVTMVTDCTKLEDMNFPSITCPSYKYENREFVKNN